MRKQIDLQKTSVRMTIDSAFEQFIRTKRNQNLSEESIYYYYNVKKFFVEFFSGKNYCSSITVDTIEDYKAYLSEKETPLSSVSINTYLRGLRAILYFFMEREYMPKFKISLIKQEKKIKETYTDAELKLLLAKPDIKKCDFSEYRNWAISNYLLATGNRLSTVCDLRVADIDFQNHEISLKKVKNRRQYIIPLSIRLEKILNDYLLYRKGEPNNYLFCNRFGEKLQKSALATAMRRYNKVRGVEKTSIHLYRHTFAKNWILNGGDIFRLKTILGHSSLDIVKEYVNIYGSDLNKDFERFNPLENMSSIFSSHEAIRMK